jgi:hypothetical protein
MDLVLLSTITGQGVKACMTNLSAYATQAPRSRRLLYVDKDGRAHNSMTRERIDSCTSRDIVWACLEDALPDAAAEKLRRLFPSPSEKHYGLSNVLALPYLELAEACRKALENTVTHLHQTGVARGYLTLHPVLYHQQTTEFVQPYDPAEILAIFQSHGINARWVISLHDDVLDIHRRLLPENRLFAAHSVRKHRGCPTERKSFLDIEQQQLLLEWRAAELAEARKIATLIKAKHHLLHQKCRLRTFWSITMEDVGSVYFSHPISQPRRDITGIPHPKKCRVPDATRGNKFISECNLLADVLADSVPLVEPTNIDEFRFADVVPVNVLLAATEGNLLSAIMPPLTPRWPITKKPRFGERPNDAELTANFLPVGDSIFRGLKPGGPLEAHRGALELLGAGIKRQISIRDIALAEQADLIVVYRPFTEPDSPEASGGVTGEIQTAARKATLRRDTCRPPVLMIHPLEDERRRRKVYFDQNWDSFVRVHCEGLSKADFHGLQTAAWAIIERAPFNPDIEQMRAEFDNLLDAKNIAVTGRMSREKSVLSSDSYSVSSSGRAVFISELLEQYSFIKPDILRDFGDMIRVEDLTDMQEIAALVRDILEDFHRSLTSAQIEHRE